MAAHRTDCGKVIKFGTLIEDSVNSNHTTFGVSNSNSLAPPLVQIFNFVMLITFINKKILVSSESLAQAESNEVHNSKIARFMHFSCIFIFNCSENLLCQTRPRWFVRFSPKLTQIIYRPCWQKVMEFKSIRPGVLEYHTNEFAKKHAKMDLRLYLRKGLTD